MSDSIVKSIKKFSLATFLIVIIGISGYYIYDGAYGLIYSLNPPPADADASSLTGEPTDRRLTPDQMVSDLNDPSKVTAPVSEQYKIKIKNQIKVGTMSKEDQLRILNGLNKK